MTTTRMQLDNTTPAGPVTCLGQTFASDTARREHFSALLREKLKDPAFRAIEGFPHGADDDIIALSDPPYYTACPNPWLADFVAEWEAQKPAEQREAPYSREPFAADVSEGKNDPIYNAHSYHTKVPHKAIMRYILHYTQPGDIVFDGFCGTGMTGVAAQMCGNQTEVESLGYRVDKTGVISQEVVGTDGKKTWQPFSKLGARKAILNDLSPAATFIAYNYNTPVDVQAFEREAKRILAEVEADYGWMYETTHTDGRKGKIDYTVWSDVFVCINCLNEIVYWDAAFDKASANILESFLCPNCGISITKRQLEHAFEMKTDSVLNSPLSTPKQKPVLIKYSLNSKKFEKIPDIEDLKLLNKIREIRLGNVPLTEIPNGDKLREALRLKLRYMHQLFTERTLLIFASIGKKTDSNLGRLLINSVSSTLNNKLVRYNFGNRGNGILSGTIYIPSLHAEANPFRTINGKVTDFARAFVQKSRNALSCQSFSNLLTDDNSIDYLFIDPPFGANINYSELNFIWESWLRVSTNSIPEAIQSPHQSKQLSHYMSLMTKSFIEAYRVLKPGRWMTVEFSNTNASVWNSIQTAIANAGFFIAAVAAIDKRQGSFNAVTSATAVKQDLVISAYKPTHEFEARFAQTATSVEGVWEFVRNHLQYLPTVKRNTDGIAFISERDPRILYDQVIAYYIRKGFPVPIDSPSFQTGLAQRFVERDGMYFLADQVAEYDRAVQQAGSIIQANMFVSDESSAIQWLRQVLKRKPQTFADINPEFMQQLGGWSKNETQLDLRILLEQNFLNYSGEDAVPNQIHAYLSSNYQDMRNKADTDPALRAKAKDRWYVPDPNKAQDLDQVRERALLREFDGYVAQTGKLKVFRIEAIRAGFKRAYAAQQYKQIVDMAKRLPVATIEEDEKLLMWVDNARTRIGE
jgi:DNA modification methylase